MGSTTLYVILIVSLVQFQVILCKPFLFDLICDLVCDDDDNTTTSSSDDVFGFDDICSCGSPTQAPPTSVVTRGDVPPSVNLNLPGVSLQMSNSNGQWSLNVNANPSTPANSVIPLPTGGPVGPAVPMAPGVPGGPGGPQLPAAPGSSPLPGGPTSPVVPGVTGAPPGPTTAAAVTAAAATPAAA